MATIKTIVLIDDDSELGQLVKINLSAQYDIKFFEDPFLAMQYIKKHEVVAVILDYHLKNTSGLLVAWDLLEACPLTPILLISADQTVQEKITELCFRHVSFLPKPFTGRDLITSLAEIQKIANFEDIRPVE